MIYETIDNDELSDEEKKKIVIKGVDEYCNKIRACLPEKFDLKEAGYLTAALDLVKSEIKRKISLEAEREARKLFDSEEARKLFFN